MLCSQCFIKATLSNQSEYGSLDTSLQASMYERLHELTGIDCRSHGDSVLEYSHWVVPGLEARANRSSRIIRRGDVKT